MMKSILENVVEFNRNSKLQSKENEYNIFSVLGIQSKEVLVCRMIADLLNPRGQHNMGSSYLKLFVRDILQMGDIDVNILDRAVVTAEYMIDENRRIDILIEIGKTYIPIEVKIYAAEQKSQCYDYYKFAKSKDRDTNIVYLTRLGHMPSDYSTNGEFGTVPNHAIKCISFRNDITYWLRQCLKISSTKISEIIWQFMISIEDITDCTDKEVIEIVSKDLTESPETLKAGIQIADSIDEAKSRVLYTVLAEFEKQMKNLERKYDLERIKWHDYSEWANSLFYHKYSTFPGINYIVKNAKLNDGYQLWMRIEVEHRLFAGFCIFDPNGVSDEGIGNKVDEFDDVTKASICNILKVTGSEQNRWWVIWKYLPTGNTKVTKEVPNFKEMNDAAIVLVDEERRKAFVEEAIKQIEISLFSLIKLC